MSIGCTLLAIASWLVLLTAQGTIDAGRRRGAVVLVQTRFARVEFGLLQ